MVCTNFWFGYECDCLNGFRMMGDSCVDIDECVENEPCDDACENLEGSFRCSCKDKFLLSYDQQTCTGKFTEAIILPEPNCACEIPYRIFSSTCTSSLENCDF